MRRVDVTITLSDAELALLRAELPEKHVALLPWIVRPAAAPPGYAARRDLIFFGSFMHPPNADAIVNFVQTLWPALRARLPGVALRIVGSGQGAGIARLAGDGIEVVGHGEDLQAVLDRARVAIAPLRWGAGFKGKVATAMAAGLPNVVSPVAAEGMGIADGET